MSKEKERKQETAPFWNEQNLELIFRKFLENLSFACLKYNWHDVTGIWYLPVRNKLNGSLSSSGSKARRLWESAP